jgi:hypothetical protein
MRLPERRHHPDHRHLSFNYKAFVSLHSFLQLPPCVKNVPCASISDLLSLVFVFGKTRLYQKNKNRLASSLCRDEKLASKLTRNYHQPD